MVGAQDYALFRLCFCEGHRTLLPPSCHFVQKRKCNVDAPLGPEQDLKLLVVAHTLMFIVMTGFIITFAFMTTELLTLACMLALAFMIAVVRKVNLMLALPVAVTTTSALTVALMLRFTEALMTKVGSRVIFALKLAYMTAVARRVTTALTEIFTPLGLEKAMATLMTGRLTATFIIMAASKMGFTIVHAVTFMTWAALPATFVALAVLKGTLALLLTMTLLAVNSVSVGLVAVSAPA